MADTFKLVGDRPTIEMDPDAVLDYYQGWTKWLAGNADTIVSATVITHDITCDEHTIVLGKGVVVWMSRGTPGKVASATIRITTAGGRTDDRTLYFRIKDR